MHYSSLFRSIVFGLTFVLGGALAVAEPRIEPNPHWEPEIKSMEARDRLRPAADDAILFVGSSSIRLWSSLAQDFPELHVYNHGFGGSYLIDSIAYADRIVLPLKPKTIVLYAGTNDIEGGVSPETLAEQFKLFVRTVRDQLPDTRILYISIAPNPSRWHLRNKIQQANRLIENHIKAGENMVYIDVYSAMLGSDGRPLPDIYRSDELHMNPKGYAIWTAILGPRLKKPGDAHSD